MTSVRGASAIDAKRKARANAEATIASLQQHEDGLAVELRTLAAAARQAQKAAARHSLKSVLLKSRGLRQQQAAVAKKRGALQAHLDTLRNSELNEQVLSSVKETSKVLKTMGLDQSLADMDEVVMDMQEAQNDLQSLQQGLSEGMGNMSGVDADEADLDAELELLLCDAPQPLPLAAPAVPNSMRPALVEPVPVPHSAPAMLIKTTSAEVTNSVLIEETPTQPQYLSVPEKETVDRTEDYAELASISEEVEEISPRLASFEKT